MLSYPAAIPLSTRTLHHLAGLIRQHRERADVSCLDVLDHPVMLRTQVALQHVNVIAHRALATD